MNENRKKIQRLTLAAFFAAIEVIMGFTPIGYIPVGTLSITTMHLPVILASILIGPQFGAGMGFLFGLTSFLRATFEPGITSFVFTPFVSVGSIKGDFRSLLICFVPRILLGILPGLLYRLMHRKLNETASAAAAAVLGTILHTLMVLGGIWIFFGDAYAQALGLSRAALGAILLGTISTNMVLEAILAGIAIPALCRALRPIAVKMGVIYGES